MRQTKKFAEAKICRENLLYLQRSKQLTDVEMARIIGKSKATWSSRKNQKPQDMTLAELMRAAEFFGIENAAQLLVPMRLNEVTAYAVDE